MDSTRKKETRLKEGILWPLDNVEDGHRLVFVGLALSLCLSVCLQGCSSKPFWWFDLAAMASTPGFLHPLPSPPLLCLPSSSSSCSSSSCISPRLNRCSVAYLVSRELRTNCGFRRVEVLRAAESEITAPAPVRTFSVSKFSLCC